MGARRTEVPGYVNVLRMPGPRSLPRGNINELTGCSFEIFKASRSPGSAGVATASYPRFRGDGAGSLFPLAGEPSPPAGNGR